MTNFYSWLGWHPGDSVEIVLFVLIPFIVAGLVLWVVLPAWADREEASQRKRFDALIGMHERPVNYPPAKGAKGWDGRKTRKSA